MLKLKSYTTKNSGVPKLHPELTQSLVDGHDLEPFGYPPADLLPLAPLDAIMTDTASTSAYVKELLSNDEEVTQAPPAKCKRTYDLWRSHKCAIEAPPADHWSEDDFIDIYGSVDGDIAEAAGLKPLAGHNKVSTIYIFCTSMLTFCSLCLHVWWSSSL